MASTPTNAVWRNSFDESELTTIKAAADAALPWPDFFKQLEENFNPKHLVFKYESGLLVCQLKVGSGTAPFVLKKADAGVRGDTLFLDSLYDFYVQRSDKKEMDNYTEQLHSKQTQLTNKLKQVTVERTSLQESVCSAESEEKALLAQQAELESELTDLKNTMKERGEDMQIPPPINPDTNSSCGKIPAEGLDIKNMDLHLIQLIKSKWTPAEGPSTVTSMTASFEQQDNQNQRDPPPCNNICRPLTYSEYESQLKGLSKTHKGHVIQTLHRIDKWDFDVITVQDLTGNALWVVGYALLVKYDFLRIFRLNEEVVLNWLAQIETGYHPNPYHNSMHAADVTHVLHYILSAGGLAKKAHLSKADQFAAILAALIHDYDHPGINNNFHIKVQSYLAILYNDRSILENHHCAEVFELMKNPRYNILGCLPEEQRRDIRETMIEMVLSTDMGLHAKILTTWKRRLLQDHDLYRRKEDQRLALSMGIKMADISNCGRPTDIYLKWSTKIAEEFYMQGDRERSAGFGVSPFMDRYHPTMAKGQIAFMNFIVVPLFETVCEFCPDMHFCTEQSDMNRQYWSNNNDDI